MADPSKTILLVDDEERDLEAICALLESTGYKVCTASSYANAFGCMEEFPYIPDLLVSDIALSDVNGIELYRKLSHMGGVWLNVLFISAYSGAEVLKAYGLPMSDVHFLAKPFDSSVFLDRVRSLIERPITFRLAS